MEEGVSSPFEWSGDTGKWNKMIGYMRMRTTKERRKQWKEREWLWELASLLDEIKYKMKLDDLMHSLPRRRSYTLLGWMRIENLVALSQRFLTKWYVLGERVGRRGINNTFAKKEQLNQNELLNYPITNMESPIRSNKHTNCHLPLFGGSDTSSLTHHHTPSFSPAGDE